MGWDKWFTKKKQKKNKKLELISLKLRSQNQQIFRTCSFGYSRVDTLASIIAACSYNLYVLFTVLGYLCKI